MNFRVITGDVRVGTDQCPSCLKFDFCVVALKNVGWKELPSGEVLNNENEAVLLFSTCPLFKALLYIGAKRTKYAQRYDKVQN